jgi:hypothetical protein
LLLAHVFEGVIELVAHLIAHHPADADPARLGQGFKTCRDVDPIAKDVVFLNDHIAEINADPKPDAPLFGYLRSRSIIPL